MSHTLATHNAPQTSITHHFICVIFKNKGEKKGRKQTNKNSSKHQNNGPAAPHDHKERYQNVRPENADRFKEQAEELREQIRRMEDKLGDQRKRSYDDDIPPASPVTTAATTSEPTLRNKRILVAGAHCHY